MIPGTTTQFEAISIEIGQPYDPAFRFPEQTVFEAISIQVEENQFRYPERTEFAAISIEVTEVRRSRFIRQRN